MKGERRRALSCTGTRLCFFICIISKPANPFLSAEMNFKNVCALTILRGSLSSLLCCSPPCEPQHHRNVSFSPGAQESLHHRPTQLSPTLGGDLATCQTPWSPLLSSAYAQRSTACPAPGVTLKPAQKEHSCVSAFQAHRVGGGEV